MQAVEVCGLHGATADRVVLLGDGRDGSVAQVTGGRVVSATVVDPAGLEALPGVSGVRVEGSRINLTCGGRGPGRRGVDVLLGWLVVVGGLVIVRYRRDALRV